VWSKTFDGSASGGLDIESARPPNGVKKIAPSYSEELFEAYLRETRIFMEEKAPDDLNEASRMSCEQLFGKAATKPENWPFKDRQFAEFITKIAYQNEAMVLHEMRPWLVLSAGYLAALSDDKKLDCLRMTYNEKWNCSIPLLSKRPQPDYSVGFGVFAFDRQLIDLDIALLKPSFLCCHEVDVFSIPDGRNQM
jgi:hypothetical protein